MFSASSDLQTLSICQWKCSTLCSEFTPPDNTLALFNRFSLVPQKGSVGRAFETPFKACWTRLLGRLQEQGGMHL